jgi:glycosyltransferase involved in cell wall biosynthesis
MKTTLVFLTWNELPALKKIFDKVPIDITDEVIAVDAGSTDGTIEFFKEKGIRVIIQKKQGRGLAFRDALNNTEGDVLIYFSPDGNENPDDIPKLIEKIKEGYDLVIASRFTKNAKSDDSDDPLRIRKFGNRFFTLLVNLFWKAKVTDAINGFRAIKRSALKELNQDARGHEVEFQMTIRAAKLGYKIAEIPTIEMKRLGGEIKANTWEMGYRFMCFFLKELLIGKRFLR